MAEEKKKEEKAEKPKEEAKAEPAKEAAKPSAAKKVNYVYGALLLHSAGKPVDEDGLKKVVEAAGEKPDNAQVKALVSSLDGVDIDDAIKSAAVPMAGAAAAPAADSAATAKKEEQTEEQAEKKAEEAAAGLSSLFG